MSIRDIWKDRVERGMLRVLEPKSRGESKRRVMLLGERLWRCLDEETDDVEWNYRVGELWADLETFIFAREIRPDYLFQLYPRSKGIWEIRSVKDSPSIRVFGFFAEKDVFIALTCALRGILGASESREWKQAQRDAVAEWNGIFSSYQPAKDAEVRTLVTGAIDGKYFK